MAEPEQDPVQATAPDTGTARLPSGRGAARGGRPPRPESAAVEVGGQYADLVQRVARSAGSHAAHAAFRLAAFRPRYVLSRAIDRSALDRATAPRDRPGR